MGNDATWYRVGYRILGRIAELWNADFGDNFID
jgi:hypothetical protein